jgi:hypothetical protein
MGGVQYFAIGSSTVELYVRSASLGSNWLAPLPLVFRGASAFELAGDASHSRSAERIMRWAVDGRGRQQSRDVPVFLKFGAVDVEPLWV